MALLKPLTREEIAPDLVSLCDECERGYPDFRHLWPPIAQSPIVFRHVSRQLLELERASPVEARAFEIAILVVSHVTRCESCVVHHTPRALHTGRTVGQVACPATIGAANLDESTTWPRHPG